MTVRPACDLRRENRRGPAISLAAAALFLVSFWMVSIERSRAADPKAPAPAAANADVPPEHAKLMAEGLEIYKKDVKAILAKRCLDCHNGVDTTEGGFSLATREALLKGGKKGKAVVPGKSQESNLFRMVAHLEEPHMPKDEDKLPDAEIAQLAAWIDRYAPYDGDLSGADTDGKSWTTRAPGEKTREFWSYQPLAKVSVPDVARPEWSANPIDRFILSRLEKEKIEPSPEVDRRRLIRRLSFDLLGLPPEPESIDAFVSDESPDAYDRLVDRMLANPHFGERWGRHWLDLARFAESHGFEHDYDRETAYHYRDFVIQALNKDVPYDTFVKWQLAGDEFAPEENLAMMATGFLAAGVHSTQITKNEVEKHRYDELDDMLATTGTAMLGLTIGCARCHDHKFDAIPQGDYYRLLSTFTTTIRSEVELNFDKEGYARAKQAFDSELAPLLEKQKKYEAEALPAKFAKWEAGRTDADLPTWVEPVPFELISSGGATFTIQDDGSILVSGKAAAKDVWTLTFKMPDGSGEMAGARLETLSDPTLPERGPGRNKDGNFSLSDLKITIAPQIDKEKPENITLRNPRATFEQKDAGAAAAIDGDPKTGWGVSGEAGRSHAAAFEFAKPVGHPAGSIVTVTLKFENENLQPGRIRFAVTTANGAPAIDSVGAPTDVLYFLKEKSKPRVPEQTAGLVKWFRRIDADWLAHQKQIDDKIAKAPQPDLRKVLVSSEGLAPIRLHSQGEDFFPETFFLRRGDTNQKEGPAPVGYLQVLMRTPEGDKHWPVAAPPKSRTSFRRTALASWITDTNEGAGNLLARVIVNRLWQHHFGRGIVATPSDFGTRGELPTHPELLDWLAAELIRNEWQLKPIHHLIVTSAAYRQSSAGRPEVVKVDPDNKLVWRHTRRRLEGEVIRDALLGASGVMEQRMFGPGTLDEQHRRRSIYFTVKRSQLAPMMQVFDAPDALSSVGERPSTTIAPQALMLLNNPATRDWSRGFAKKIIAKTGNAPDQMIRGTYLTALGREPNDSESHEAQEFLIAQSATYAAEDRTESALTDFCQIILCLNEFIYVE
ncbi:MAG: PSD1 and planctomycete cytochrome C domain-containing protein [Planctomycetaceae bacterium]